MTAKPAGNVGICIVTSDAAYARGLANAFRVNALKRYFGGGSKTTLKITNRSDADICIYAFVPGDFDGTGLDRCAATVAADPARLKILLELISPVSQGPILAETQKKNAAIAALSDRNSGHLIPLMSKFLRWGPERLLSKSGEPSLRGYMAIANAVAKIVDGFVLRTALRHSGDADATRDSAVGARKILNELRWQEPFLPRLLKMPYSETAIETFQDGQIWFASYPSWGRVPFEVPLDWSMTGPNRSWQSYFLGLEFVNAVLAFCHAAMSDENYRHRDAVEAVLQPRGLGWQDSLDRAGDVIADFVRNNAPDSSAAGRAWHEGTVSRRLRTLLTYLLCCARAEKHGGTYDAECVMLAHRGIIDCIELLRSDSVYVKAGNHGVRQDAMLIVASLLLSGGVEGKKYLKDGLARLARWQLEEALSSDGVWLENSFGYHCLVMGMLAHLVADLRTAGERDVGPVLDALDRMCTFVEAMIKIDGFPPLIGDTEPKYYLRALVGARRLLNNFRDGDDDDPKKIDPATFTRTKDTYFFPDAGYFVSHSSTGMDPEGTSAVFYANLSTPKHKHSDDLSVLFTHGATDLLLDGGTYNKEVGDQIRNAARFDPASHNTYRVDGKGYELRSVRDRRPAGLTKMWQGEDWAAAEGFNTAYAGGSVRRLVIHLKAHSALIVVDRLESSSRNPATFEQFWHIAPQFTAPTDRNDQLEFSSVGAGRLSIAFDPEEATIAVEHGGPYNPIAWLMVGDEKTVPTPYIRRAKTLREGVMATLFRWTPNGRSTAIDVSRARRDALKISVQGDGFSRSFIFNAASLRETAP